MARQINAKCLACAGEDVAIAKAKSCWAGKVCHNRRSRNRHRVRINTERRIARNREKVKTFKVEIEQQAYALAYLERATGAADSPILSIYIEIKKAGRAIAQIETVDARDWRGPKVRQYLTECLKLLNEQFGITRLAEVIENVKAK